MTRKPPRAAGATPDWKSAEIANHFATALRHHHAGDLRAAEQSYRLALAADPRHVDSLHYLGVLAQQVGRNDVAIDLIGKAIAINGRIPECHYNIGLAYGALGRLGEAEAHNRRAIALKPDYAEAHANLGNALAAQGKPADALASYQRALALRPQSPETHYNVANTLAGLGRGGEALRHYAEALALRPDYAEAHNNLGTVLTAQGKTAEAVAAHKRAVALKPGLVAAHVNLGNALRDRGEADEAIAGYRRAVALDPNYAEAHNNLGAMLMARDDFREAAGCFQRALALKPDLAAAAINLAKTLIALGDLEQALAVARRAHDLSEIAETRTLFFLCLRDPRAAVHAAGYRAELIRAMSEPWGNPRVLTGVAAEVIRRDPVIGACIERANAAWPARLSADELFPSGLAPLARDRLLRCLLESVQINDIALERLLTAVRSFLLEAATREPASEAVDDDTLSFHWALARQCFINEYVFACTERETDDVSRLRDAIAAALASGAPISSVTLAAVAAFVPLHTLPKADALLTRSWPEPVQAALVQQVSEPQEEAQLRAAMPRLTAVEDAVSLAVREQYEQNPYPRWTRTAAIGKPQGVEAYLRDRFPLAPLRPLGDTTSGKTTLDYLIAGCGTGQQVAGVALLFNDIRLTAIDLSLTSLGYARRMTRAMGLNGVEFAQADILKLATLGRTFDVIDSAGVLHHLADPEAGWRVLLSILRPGGIMRIALYSKLARRDIAAARDFIAARRYGSTPQDIRACRQEIMGLADGAALKNVAGLIDFFSLSECRDLLFHVQEHTLELPQIGRFLADNGLEFLGFELEPHVLAQYAAQFPDDRAKTDLGHWHAFEQANPDTFIATYHFWLQKRAD